MGVGGLEPPETVRPTRLQRVAFAALPHTRKLAGTRRGCSFLSLTTTLVATQGWLPRFRDRVSAVHSPDPQKSGRSGEVRTPDLLLPKQTRYQLRYTPTENQCPWLDSNQRPDLAPGILVLHHCTLVLEGGLLYQLSYKGKTEKSEKLLVFRF